QVLGVTARFALTREILFDFARRDSDAAFDDTTLDLGGDHFLAQLFAKVRVVHALPGELGGKFGERHTVALRDLRERHVQPVIGNLEPRALGELQLQFGIDHAFQYLTLKDVVGRQLRSAAFDQHRAQLRSFAVEFALHDHVFVDHGDDAV